MVLRAMLQRTVAEIVELSGMVERADMRDDRANGGCKV